MSTGDTDGVGSEHARGEKLGLSNFRAWEGLAEGKVRDDTAGELANPFGRSKLKARGVASACNWLPCGGAVMVGSGVGGALNDAGAEEEAEEHDPSE